MAIRYAVASGNWSAPATWDGGSTIPSSTDDVYSNNFTVTINQNITVNSLKKISNGSPAIAAGGSFTITGAWTVTITAGIAASDMATNSTNLLTVNAGSSAVVINANATGGAGTGRVAIAVIGGSGTVAINGNLVGGANVQAYALSTTGGTCTVTHTGNATGGAGGNAINHGAGTLISSGDFKGGSANDSTFGVACSSDATLRGNFYPGTHTTSGQTAQAVYATSGCRVSGDIYVGGLVASTGNYGAFPIRGQWCVIDGEDTFIHLYNDSGFPGSDNHGTEVIFEAGGGGTNSRWLNVGGVATPIG